MVLCVIGFKYRKNSNVVEIVQKCLHSLTKFRKMFCNELKKKQKKVEIWRKRVNLSDQRAKNEFDEFLKLVIECECRENLINWNMGWTMDI